MSVIEKGLVYAIIPARSGSTSIKDKNIRLIAGHPLISYSIVAAKLTPSIKRIIVSTDSEKYAGIAKKYGAEVPFLRPADISGKYSTDYEFMSHAVNWFNDHEKKLPEFWVHLRPTSPLRCPDYIESAINCIKNNDIADCLRSVHKTNNCPYKWFTITSSGYLSNICGLSLDEANGPRQKYPQVYIPNGYVDIIRTQSLMKNHNLHGEYGLSFETPELIDIDYDAELDIINEQVSKFKTESIMVELSKIK